MKEIKKINYLPPFKNFILENFPFIEEDFDALTNYELLCHLVCYIRKMGAEFNQIAIDVNSLINWFNNLDVQDEINNKLDQMALDGTLEAILLNYTNITKTFLTCEDLKADTTLVDGSKVKTLGYYSVNDGGNATYLISESAPSSYYETLANGLYAELIIDDNTTVLQFGVKNDGETDSTTQLRNAIAYCKKDLKGCSGTVIISEPIDITLSSGEELNIDFKGGTIKVNANNQIDYMLKIKSAGSYRIPGSIKNLKLNGNGQSYYGLYLNDTRKFYINKCEFTSNITSEFILDKTGLTETGNFIMEDCFFTGGYEYGLANCYNSKAMIIDSSDSHITNVVTLTYLIHIENKGNNFYNLVHSWNYKSDTLDDSVMFKTNRAIQAANCYCDTLTSMVYCVETGLQVHLINPIYYLNSNFYTSENSAPLPIKLTDEFINDNGRIKITNGRFQNISGRSGTPFINYTPTDENFRLNLLSLEATYTGNYFVYSNFKPYFDRDLVLTNNTTDFSDNSPYFKRLITKHGETVIDYRSTVKGWTSSMENQWITLATINNSDFIVQTTQSYIGFYRNTNNNDIFPIMARITADKELQVNVPTGANITNGNSLIFITMPTLLNTMYNPNT